MEPRSTWASRWSERRSRESSYPRTPGKASPPSARSDSRRSRVGSRRLEEVSDWQQLAEHLVRPPDRACAEQLITGCAVPVDQALPVTLQARNREQVFQDPFGFTGLNLMFPPLASEHVFACDPKARGRECPLGVIDRHVVRLDQPRRIEPRCLERLEEFSGKRLEDHHGAARTQHPPALSYRGLQRRDVVQHVAAPDEIDGSRRHRHVVNRAAADADTAVKPRLLDGLRRGPNAL